MLKFLSYFLLFILLVFTANAMQDTKTQQFSTVKTTISIDLLIGVLGIGLSSIRRRKTKRKKQSKLGKWLRNIAAYIMFGIGGVFVAVMFICGFILAGLSQGGYIPNISFFSTLAVIFGLLVITVASYGLANLFFYFGKLLLKDEGNYTVPFPDFH